MSGAGAQALSDATLRALAGRPGARHRGALLILGGERRAVLAPQLQWRPPPRALCDALALRLRHSDPLIEREWAPPSLLERLVMDLLEQARVESLAPAELPGLRANLDAALNDWRRRFAAAAIESEAGKYLFALNLIARVRLQGLQLDEHSADQIESSRFELARALGGPLAALARHREAQRAYVAAAAEIAAWLAARLAAQGRASSAAGGQRALLRLLPLQPLLAAEAAPQPPADGQSAGGSGGAGEYRVWDRSHDRISRSERLLSARARARATAALADLRRAHPRDIAPLVSRLQRALRTPVDRVWDSERSSGHLDPRRLVRLISGRNTEHIFRRPLPAPRPRAAVSFLVDNSGSMKRQPLAALVWQLDGLCTALERAGAQVEVLGYTTNSFNGGRPRRRWEQLGRPAAPGRLCETHHIVYRAAARTGRGAGGIAHLLETGHYHEAVDGEALEWAWRRLLALDSPRRLLVWVSDGPPRDSATLVANDSGLLERHLCHTLARIGADGRVRVAGLGLGFALDHYLDRASQLALDTPFSSASSLTLVRWLASALAPR